MTNERLAETIDRLTALFEPVLEREGFEIVTMHVGRDRRVFALKMMIDRLGRAHYAPTVSEDGERVTDGVTVDDCARVHRLLKAIIDGEGVLGDDYSMEVSSPGVNRPLTRPEHFEKATGLKVRLKTRVPIAGTDFFIAPLVSAGDEGVVLAVGDEQVDVPYRSISKANVEHEF